MLTSATSFSNREPHNGKRWVWLWGLNASILLLTLHPIVANDFWWQIARGRAIFEGQIAPSRALLAYEANADADWLGGLPWYLLYSVAGSSVITWVVALATVILATSLLNNDQSRDEVGRWKIILIFLGFVAASSAWSPTPAMIDACGIIVCWRLAGRISHKARALTIGKLLLCQLLWANLATLSLLGLLVTFVRLHQVDRDGLPSLNRGQQIGLGGLMVLCGSATPRGVYTLWDSLRLLLPWIIMDGGTLEAARILPAFPDLFAAEFIAFAILCGINLSLLATKSSAKNDIDWPDFGITIAVILIAESSTTNVAPASLLLMLWTRDLLDRQQSMAVIAEKSRSSGWLNCATTIGLIALGMSLASGLWPGSQSRLGWGLSSQLEPTLLEHALDRVKLDGTAYCYGAREAGLLAWLRPGSIRPADQPLRALLSDRLPDHVRIAWDLAQGWTDQHRRADGSWGGWLIPLRERHTRLILIPADELAIVRALNSSFWKPLTIDAPSIVYGSTRDPLLERQIIQTHALLELIEGGEWTYTAPAITGTGDQFDLYGWLTGTYSRDVDLRQARTLAAMKQHVAALKVLSYGLRSGNDDAKREFCKIQLALAYREALAVGQATRWRMCAYLDGSGAPEALIRVNPAGESVLTTSPEGFISAVSAYGRGDLESAKKALSVDHAESLYALSQIALEEGKPRRAVRWFRELTSKFPNSPEAEATRHARVELYK